MWNSARRMVSLGTSLLFDGSVLLPPPKRPRLLRASRNGEQKQQWAAAMPSSSVRKSWQAFKQVVMAPLSGRGRRGGGGVAAQALCVYVCVLWVQL